MRNIKKVAIGLIIASILLLNIKPVQALSTNTAKASTVYQNEELSEFDNSIYSAGIIFSMIAGFRFLFAFGKDDF